MLRQRRLVLRPHTTRLNATAAAATTCARITCWTCALAAAAALMFLLLFGWQVHPTLLQVLACSMLCGESLVLAALEPQHLACR